MLISRFRPALTPPLAAVRLRRASRVARIEIRPKPQEIFAFSILVAQGGMQMHTSRPRAWRDRCVRDTSDSLSGPFGTSPLERAVCGGFQILRNAPRRPRSPPTANDHTHPTDTLFQFTRVLASCGAHGCWR